MESSEPEQRYTDKIFQLSAGLFHDTVLTAEDYTHTTKITDFRSTYDQRVDVEASAG